MTRLPVLLSLLLVALAGCGGGAVLRNPAPFSTQQQDPAAMRYAILETLPQTHWTAEMEGPGFIVARLDVRSHQARVRIDYDARGVKIGYIDSVNLDFVVDQQGVPRIHPNYNTWVERLALSLHQAIDQTVYAQPGYPQQPYQQQPYQQQPYQQQPYQQQPGY